MASSNSKLFISFVLLSISLQVSGDCKAGPCFPSPKEIKSKFEVKANSTCGIDGPENYCTPSDQSCNTICNAEQPNLRHPPSYVNDALTPVTFWKSKNVERPVYLQMDFNSTFMIYVSAMKFYFELPAAAYLAKSVDYGKSFQPLAYFATDCMKFFGMSTTAYNKKNGLAVECFLIDKQLMSAKQIDYLPMQDRIASDGVKTSQQNQSFFLMTNLRLMLVSYVTPERFNISTATENLKRGLSFSVEDWSIQAACYCSGQASTCQNDTHCVCERNTAGRNCEKCLPLFNNRPYEIWKECQDCGCNNHAQSCHYNATKGHGVCDNCAHNTTGDKCQLCKVENYRNGAVMKNHSQTCLPCGCDLNGVPNVWNRTHCHLMTGQCQCKQRVHGRACDTCKPTYWNLKDTNSLGCEECNCSDIGTMNASQLCNAANNGQCPCKANVDGRTCNKCKDGYYNLTAHNPHGCLACNCHLAGSVGVSCNSTGGCSCRPKFYGLKCEKLEEGFYAAGHSDLSFEAEDASFEPKQEYVKYTVYDSQQTLTVGVTLMESNDVANPTKMELMAKLPTTAFYSPFTRYMTSSDWYNVKITLELRSIFTPFSCDGGKTNITRNKPYVFLANASAASESVTFASGICLRSGEYSVVLELTPGSSGGKKNATITLDSVGFIPTVSMYDLYKFVGEEIQKNISFYYKQALSGARSWSMHSRYGCQALSGFYGYIFGEGQACSCNATGSNNPDVCDQCGGQCSCKPNVIRRTCDRCRPDYFNFTSGYGCQACLCHAKGSNRTSCHATTGQCDCKANVINRQCSACKPSYYNLNSGNGCLPCNCMADYSMSLQCHADTGVCSCKQGVGGTKCTECKDTFYNLTTEGCTECNCNDAGSHNLTCHKTSGKCFCKEHSMGRTCDRCPGGYYGLGSSHPKGCLQCQCSNKTSNCSTAEGWKDTEVSSSFVLNSNFAGSDGWLVKSADGQTLETPPWKVEPSLSAGLVNNFMGFIRTKASDERYFSAPAKYVKEGRFAYTYTMSFRLRQDNHTSPENSIKGDVILKGKGFNQPIVYRLPSPPVSTRFTAYTIKFIESDWFVNTTQGRRPTSSEIVAVLSTLEYIYIRAKWSTLTDKVTRLADIKMKFSNKTNQGKTAYNVETCNCPNEYQGQFCERCAPGFTRATPNGGAYVDCVPCNCNGHSATCDPESGVCSGCQHNTTGKHCELCADGLYGKATHGTANDCKPCPCPGGPFSTNQFSPTCILGGDGNPTCNNCTEGHHGRRCEKCTNGYFGSPMDANGKCRKCNCNGNVDANIEGNCNTTTGECSNCGYNTTGSNCEKCAPNYYGNALNRTCSVCKCDKTGTRTGVPCNHTTGQCACLPHVTGKSCDRCEANAFNFSSGLGCSMCNCHLNGANKTQCNETTGVCECRTNVEGDKCDSCVPGFYGVHLSPPCQECNCSSNNTLNNTDCDVVTGQCQCKVSLGGAKYGGRQCDRCADRSVGEPDNCRQCSDGGKCFDKWYDLIQVESNKVNSLEHNVTEMLKAFGGSSVTVDSINKTIQELNKNLSYADGVFNGAQYNTKDKQEQINRIQASIDDLHRRLNESSRIINDANSYIKSTVEGFNGTVMVMKLDQSGPELDNTGSVVFADYSTLMAMAVTYRNRIVKLNETGHESFRNISTKYEAIKLANETAAQAAQNISNAMKQLTQVSLRRTEVEERLGSTFQAELQNSSAILDEIKKCSDEIKKLLTSAIALGNNATSTVNEAETIAKNANTTVHQRKLEAEKALADANNALSSANKSRENATNARNMAAQFKVNASAVLADSQAALKNVTDGINTMAKAMNQSRDSQVIADRVTGMVMPVSLDTIKGLTNEIKDIKVDEALINKTYEGADDGLKKAQEVEKLSNKAIETARKTLDEVQRIEKSIKSSNELRNETVNMQKQTDEKVKQIENITRAIEDRFGNASMIGKETLQLINKTIDTVDESLNCFNASKRTVEAAVVRAEKAYNLSLTAEKLNETVNANITKLAQMVEPLAAIAQANYTSIVKAYNDSVQLYKDVNQAEVLLDEYIKQRKEMETLQNETLSLEKELDLLIKDFGEQEKKYSSCREP